MGLRVCVSGGRDFDDPQMLFDELDKIHAWSVIDVLIHGGCPSGADHYANEWAIANGVTCVVIKADWDKYKLRDRRNPAGILRNQKLVEFGFDLLAAFPTGGPGTDDMIERTKRNDIPYRIFGKTSGMDQFFD